MLPIAGLASAGQDSAQPQAGCTRTITRAGDVHAALGAASPGDTLCFTGADLAGADLTLTRSASYIDSTIESNTVQHVAATGISLSGQRITVRRNLVTGRSPVIRP